MCSRVLYCRSCCRCGLVYAQKYAVIYVQPCIESKRLKRRGMKKKNSSRRHYLDVSEDVIYVYVSVFKCKIRFMGCWSLHRLELSLDYNLYWHCYDTAVHIVTFPFSIFFFSKFRVLYRFYYLQVTLHPDKIDRNSSDNISPWV